MKKNKSLFFCVMICVIIIMCVQFINISTQSNDIYYKDYILNILDDNNRDLKKSISYINKKLKNNKLKNKDRALDMLALETYYYMNLDTEEFKANFEKSEQILKENNMNEEIIHLYSMISRTYINEFKYEKAYVYINESERIVTNIYNKNKDSENLSTLMAIKYLKADLGIRLNLDTEADKAFKDAEQLRKNYNGRERIDIYTHISNYYYQKSDFKNIEKYTKKAIEYLDKYEVNSNNNEIVDVYKYDYILSKFMLSESYINQNQIENAINVLNETKKYDYFIKDFLLSKKYKIYSLIYSYYGLNDKALESLELSYDAVKDSSDIITKIKIVSKIIEISDSKNNNYLQVWYKKLVQLYSEYENLSDKQFLLNKIISSDVIEAELVINTLQYNRIVLNVILIIGTIVLIISLIILKNIYYKSKYDNLTNLYNRNYFNKFFDKHKNKPHNIIIFDIDNFKKINDMYGHKFGDLVLERVSNEVIKLKYNIKAFRYGGEEFVLITNKYSYDDTIKIAEELRVSVSNLTFKEDVKVTISLGISSYSGEHKDTLKIADENLYKSKNSGKNKTTYI